MISLPSTTTDVHFNLKNTGDNRVAPTGRSRRQKALWVPQW
jgi:hypothetical protein